MKKMLSFRCPRCRVEVKVAIHADVPEARKRANIQADAVRENKILRLALRGMKPVDIAKQLGVDQSTVYYCINAR